MTLNQTIAIRRLYSILLIRRERLIFSTVRDYVALGKVDSALECYKEYLNF